MITVYTTGKACMRCRWTIRRLEELGVPFATVDIREITAAREYVTNDLGYTHAPVVVVDDDDHWCGFRPDRLDTLRAYRGAS